MAHIKVITIGENDYLIEPTLYITPVLSNNNNNNIYTATLNNFAFDTGVAIYAKFLDTNPENAQLQINNNDTKDIYYSGRALEVGQIKENHIYALVYDGTRWQIVGDIDEDTQVSQIGITNIDNEYSILFKNTANTVDETASVKYNKTTNALVTINPSLGSITAPGGFLGGKAAQAENADTVNHLQVLTAVPANAIFTDHYDWSDITNIPTTLSGYGITDAHVNLSTGVITLGSNTITPITSINNYTGPSVTISAADLGLSNAIHFIGMVSTSSTYQPSDGTAPNPDAESNPTSLTLVSGITYNNPTNGDVILDSAGIREYIWIDGVWKMLGFSSSTIYSQPQANPVANQWISKITQNTDGTISATLGTLETSGRWSGNADTLTTPHEIYVQLNQDRANTDANKIKFDGSADIGIQVNGILSITHGGTNTDTLIDNRLLYTNTNNNIQSFQSSYHYISNNELAINTDTIDLNYTFKVNGDSLFVGNLIPTLSTDSTPVPINTLGSTTNRWAALYIGSYNSYGDAYTPIYWNNGVPEEIMPTQYKTFSITGNTSSSQSVVLNSPAFSESSYVLEIVVDQGTEQFLEAPITWTSSSEAITLTTKITNTQTLTGYIIVSRGNVAPTLSA